MLEDKDQTKDNVVEEGYICSRSAKISKGEELVKLEGPRSVSSWKENIIQWNPLFNEVQRV